MTAGVALGEWVGLDAPATVAGAELNGVYVGSADASEVIDPYLPVDLGAPDWDGTSVERPPRYSGLTPAARGAFLVWHRTGRRAPQAPPVWALLHLHGLERRILVDGDTDPALQHEVAALAEVYGHDDEVARVGRALTGHHDRSSPPPLTDDAAPDQLQIEVGRRALASTPIDAGWGLAWAWFHPDIPRRDAAKRAHDEFARLWTIRFDERFPEGLTVRPRRRRLALDYTPSNPSLPSPLELTISDASDVFLTTGPTQVLSEITEQVEAELAPYVRWRTRYPDDAAVASIRAAAVLPDPLLVGSPAADAARPLVDLVESVLGEHPHALADCDPLLQLWAEATGQESIDRRDALEIAQILGRFGVGIEPDVRFGGRPITRRSPAVAFRQAGVPTTSPSDGYAAALVTLELCAAVAAADGVVDDAEQAMLADRVDRVEGLTDSERARLDAHRVLVASSDLRLDDVASRMVALPLAERHALASYLLELARVDGVVTEDEVRVLRAVHELLDLNPDEVERRLRPRVVPLAPRTPIELAPAQPAAEELTSAEPAPLVEPEAKPERLVQVDEDRLAATQANNEVTRALLLAIFDNDDPEDVDPRPDEPPAAATGDIVATLDAAHSALLRDLAPRGHVSRRELELAASRHGVLPDGAIDVINEAALDLTEDPVVDVHDDESVTVDPDVYEEMRA